MAGKISEMTGVTPALTDEFELSRPNGGTPLTRKATGTDLKALIFTGAKSHPGYIAGRWYPSLGVSSAAGSAVQTTNCGLVPWIPQQSITISDLGVFVTTTSAAGNFQLAIWASDPTTNKPTGLPLGYTPANLSTTTGTQVSGALSANVSVTKDTLYFLGISCDNATAAFAAYSVAANNQAYQLGSPNLSDYLTGATSASFYYAYANTFASGLNTLNITPASVSTVGTLIRAAHIHFKVASVP